jgi:hypothetical protein
MSVEENKAIARRWNEEIVSGGKTEAFAIAIYRFSDGKIVDDWFCSRRLEV